MRTIAIVGRPNVGKSALFNRLCGHRIAIVDEAEAVTRDRLYQETEVFGVPFRLIDTGGIAPLSPGASFQEQITQQAQLAAEEADGIIMVVDATAGITTLDELVASYLRRLNKPICLAVNKLDSWDQLERVHEFRSLGIEPIVGVSAIQGLQMAELAEALLKRIPEPASEDAPQEDVINLAIVGRPNVGKSTLMNRILGEERSIVSPLAGTTRDSIDALFEQNGRTYRLIDTAGIRRKRAEKEVVDKFAAVRTERAVDRSDVCILMVDAQEGVTVQERRIIHWIEEEGKGCLILLNKWDLVPGFRMEHCVQALQEEIPFLRHVPFLCIAAQTGRNVSKIYRIVEEIYEARRRRISTGQLNKFMEKAIQACHPPMLQGGRRLRIYYLAQVSVAPPHFVLFVNDPALMTETYQRYLLNGLRKEYNFAGVPLFFTLRAKEKSRRKAPSSHGFDLPSEEPSCGEEEALCQSFEEDNSTD